MPTTIIARRSFIFTILVLLVSYFVSRLLNLTILPIFVDESTHISWAITIAEQGHFWITDAGKIFPIWVMSLFVPLAGDLLWTERLAAVLFGASGLLGCYLLGKQLFDRRIGLLASILYLTIPYTFFYDRIALVDSLLAALAVYVMLFSLAVFNHPNVINSLGLGVVMSLAILTKLNGIMLCVIPLVVAVFQLRRPRQSFPWKSLLLAYALAALGALPLIVHLSYHLGGEADRSWLGHTDLPAGEVWLYNGRQAILYLAHYLSPLVFIVACFGIGLAIIQRRQTELMLLAAAGIIVATVVFSANPNFWAPRYLLPAVPFLIVITARTIVWSIDKISQKFSTEFR